MTDDRIRHVVILCHPDPMSFNHAVAAAYCEAVGACGQTAIVRDLYALEFDPVLTISERATLPNACRPPDVEAELRVLRPCDVLVLVYPIWLGSMPAMIKGYIDRVLGSGTTPDDVRESASTLLAGKQLVSFTTSALSQPWLEEQGQPQALRVLVDDYLRRAFAMNASDHHHFGSIAAGTDTRFIAADLVRVGELSRDLCARTASDRSRAGSSSSP